MEIVNQKQNPIRVLHIVGRMDRGGIETMIMNLYRNIDRTKIQFDFLAHYGREAAYNDEIRSMGGRIYEMPALRDDTHIYYWRLIEYIIALNKFFKSHPEYKIIHCHMTNTASIYMPIAKKYGVTCRISHSHSTKGKAGMLGVVTNILQKHIYKYATDYFACSKAAAHWFYPKNAIDEGKIKIIPNSVDAEKFSFNQEKRICMRKTLGITDKLVIGCVGRFRPEKNQVFLLDVLQAVLKKGEDAVLLFAGEGECEEQVKALAKQKGIAERTLFLGMRTDIPELMQAMDVFTLPSLWEGLPVVGVEAQAAGLHCVVSDTVTQEMNALGVVDYISLKASPEEWANHIIAAAKKNRLDTSLDLKRARYDIHATADWLQEYYIQKSY